MTIMINQDIMDSIFFHSLSNFAPSVSTPAILFASARVFAVSAFASLFCVSICFNCSPNACCWSATSTGCRDSDIEYASPVLGVDPAWEGEDRSVIALRRGRYAKILFCQRHVPGDILARHAMNLASVNKAKYIFVDKTGVGASCCDALRAFGVKHIRVSFSEKPFGDMFLNKRAEMWWKMREWFQQDNVVLANYPGIKEDLIAPEYGIKENGKVYLESKEEMRRKGIHSPDLGDALALTFSLPDEMMSTLRKSNVVTMNTWEDDWKRDQRAKALGHRRII